MLSLILAAISGLIIFIAAIYLLKAALKKKEAWGITVVAGKERSPFFFWSFCMFYLFFSIMGLFVTISSIDLMFIE